MSSQTQRGSNIELYRIIVMMLIVAHHYVVNSGMMSGPIYLNHNWLRTSVFLLAGMWGKTGINCFVLITGYYMCKKEFSIKRLVKMVLEVELYRLVLYFAFLIAGYNNFELSEFVLCLLPVNSIGVNFTGCFLVLMVLVPYLNILIHNMTEKKHAKLLLIFLFIYTILSSFFSTTVFCNYVTWFCVVYLIGSYLRLYPNRLDIFKARWGLISALLIICSASSVLFIHKLNIGMDVYFFVSDSYKILAVLSSISFFMFFQNIKIKQSKIINGIASSTFGVLLIHAHSDEMRKWLWVDTLKNAEMFYSKYWFLHLCLSVIGVFTVCVIIDKARQIFIEKPFFRWYDKHFAD